MKKSLLSTAVLASFAVAGSAFAAPVPISAGNIQMVDGAPAIPANTYALSSGVYAPGFIPTSGPVSTAFGLSAGGGGAEFRMVSSAGAFAGGGEKSLVGIKDDGSTGDNGLETINWVVGDHPSAPLSGIILATDGDTTPGAANSALGAVTGFTTNADFFGQFFGFAGADPAFVNVDFVTNKITIDTVALEAQWGGVIFPMGDAAGGANECNTDGQGCGIHFEGDITPTGGGAFDFTLFGEHRVTPYEDTEGGISGASGFAGMVAQFALQGSYAPAAVPVPAAVWLFGSGLLGLVGVARRKKATV